MTCIRVLGLSVPLSLFLSIGSIQATTIDAFSYASFSSNVSAYNPNARDAEWAKLNHHQLRFNLVPGSVVYYRGKSTEATYRAPIPTEAFKVGNNVFDIAFTFSDQVRRVSGKVFAEFVLDRGTPQQRTICRKDAIEGRADDLRSCSTSISVTLAELNPSLASEIEILRHRSNSLKKELRDLGLLKPSTDELIQRIDEMMALDLEDLSSEELRQISGELDEVGRIVDGFKQELQALREKLQEELSDARTYLKGINGAVTLDDSRLYETFQVTELTLPYVEPYVELPKTDPADEGGEPARFDLLQNVYLRLANGTIERLRAALQGGRRQEFSVALEAWSETQSTLGHSLQNRSGHADPQELRAFNESVGKVREFLRAYVDDFGFFRDAGIPEDVKGWVKNQIRQAAPLEAKKLRDALNTWKESDRNPSKELVLDTIRGVGPAFGVLRDLAENGLAVRSRLLRILDQTIDAAFWVTRAGVSLSPLGDFVDFCEVMTGREFCTPAGRELSLTDRMLSAAGVIIGSGQFWRKLADVVPVSGVKAVGRDAADLIDGAHRLEPAVRKRLIEKLERLSPKVIPGTPKKDYVIYRRVVKLPAENVPGSVWSIGVRNVDADHRFSGKGVSALYVSTSSETAAAEAAYYAAVYRQRGAVVLDAIEHSRAASIQGLLDLSDAAKVKEALGIELEDLRIPGKAGYALTQEIGRLAKERGYSGIIYKSAHTDSGANIALFSDKIGVDIFSE